MSADKGKPEDQVEGQVSGVEETETVEAEVVEDVIIEIVDEFLIPDDLKTCYAAALEQENEGSAAAAEARQKMDEWKAKLDPKDDQCLLTYGEELFKGIEQAGAAINNLAEEQGLIIQNFDSLEESLRDIQTEGDASSLLDTLKSMGAQVADQAAQAGKTGVKMAAKAPGTAIGTIASLLTLNPPWAMMGVGGDAATKTLARKSAKEAEANSVLSKDAKEILQTARARHHEAKKKAKLILDTTPEWVEKVRSFGKENLEAHREIALACGAGYQRVNELVDEIQRLEAAIKKKPSQVLSDRRDQLASFVDELKQVVDDIALSRADSYRTLIVLKTALETAEKNYRAIVRQTRSGFAQQEGAIATASTALFTERTVNVRRELSGFKTATALAAAEAHGVVTAVTIANEGVGINDGKALADSIRKEAKDRLAITDARAKRKAKETDVVKEVGVELKNLQAAVAYAEETDRRLAIASATGDTDGIKRIADGTKKGPGDARAGFGTAAPGAEAAPKQKIAPPSGSSVPKKSGGPADPAA